MFQFKSWKYFLRLRNSFRMSFQSLYQPVCDRKTSKSKSQILDDYLKQNAINRNHADIEKLKERLKLKPLLLEKSLINNIKKKDNKKKKKNSSKLGRKAVKSLNLYKISKTDQKYEKFLPLHQLWKNYIQKLYENRDGKVVIRAEERILKIDLHGAKVSVQNCKCTSFIGLQGIIVKETKNMIEIILKNDNLKAIPKMETVFGFVIHGYKLTILGNSIIGRPGERLGKKFKTNFDSEMMLKNL